jgi:hypothetical protein
VADQALGMEMLWRWRGKILTPELRRRAVLFLQASFEVSERRVCAVTGQARSTRCKTPAAATTRSTVYEPG